MKSAHFLKYTRRTLSALIAGTILFGAVNLNAQNGQIAPKEYFLGDPAAKVTLIEYGSLTCIHCGHFARETYPQIHQKYVVTGKVKYAFRTLPTEPFDLSIAMQLMADCAGVKRYQVIEDFFNNQSAILNAAQNNNGALNIITRITKSRTGLDKQTIEDCLNNQQMRQHVISVAENGDREFKMSGTPSFILNGKFLGPKDIEGYDFASFSKVLDKALAAPVQKPKPVGKKKK